MASSARFLQTCKTILYYSAIVIGIALAAYLSISWIVGRKSERGSALQMNQYLQYRLETLQQRLQQQEASVKSSQATRKEATFCYLVEPHIQEHPVHHTILAQIKLGKEYQDKLTPANYFCSLTVSDILAKIRTVDPLNGFCVIFGNTTESVDMEPFLSMKYGGRVVITQPNAVRPQGLPENVKFSAVSGDMNVPETILGAFHPQYLEAKADQPYDPDFMRIPQTSDDVTCSKFFESVLLFSSPKVLIVEFNPLVPPPIIYVNKGKKGQTSEQADQNYYGCSLSAYSSIARRFGYSILQIELFQAYFIRNEYFSVFKGNRKSDFDNWNEGFWGNTFSRKLLSAYSFYDSPRPFWTRELEENHKHFLMSMDALTLLRHVNTTLQADTNLNYLLALDLPNEHQYITNYGYGQEETLKRANGQKNFIYLTQGSGALVDRLKNISGSDSDMLHLTYKTEVEGDVYFPNSTWTMGRNRLFEEVKKKEDAQGWRYKYLIFLDGDVEVGIERELKKNPWRMFEKFLLEYEPAVGVPDHKGPARPAEDLKMLFGQRFVTSVMYHHDAIVVAIHREAADALLPYETSYDNKSWWYSQLFMIYKSWFLYRTHLLTYFEVITWNPEHNDYPRESEFDKTAKEWADGFGKVPKHLIQTCMPDFLTIFTPNQWGNIRRKSFDYSTRTYWNVPNCKLF